MPAECVVDMSGVVARRIWQVQQQASIEGRGAVVLLAMARIAARLKSDPLNLGEPLYHLTALDMIVRQVIVNFAVNEEKRLVVIKGAELLPLRRRK